MDFNTITEFEDEVAKFFGAPYAVAVDCCTHGVELSLRHTKATKITSPFRTYISIPFLAEKMNMKLEWKNEDWTDSYYLTDRVVDAAVLWKRDSYIPNTLMSLSFQFQKHLNLSKGGMILTDDKEARNELKRMSYDGREPDIPWRDQNIKSKGYHYYMTPETAQIGLEELSDAIKRKPKQWVLKDWPNLKDMDIFK